MEAGAGVCCEMLSFQLFYQFELVALYLFDFYVRIYSKVE